MRDAVDAPKETRRCALKYAVEKSRSLQLQLVPSGGAVVKVVVLRERSSLVQYHPPGPRVQSVKLPLAQRARSDRPHDRDRKQPQSVAAAADS